MVRPQERKKVCHIISETSTGTLCMHRMPLPLLLLLRAVCSTQSAGRERTCCTLLRYCATVGVLRLWSCHCSVRCDPPTHPTAATTRWRHQQHIAPQYARASYYTWLASAAHRCIFVFSEEIRTYFNFEKNDKRKLSLTHQKGTEWYCCCRLL